MDVRLLDDDQTWNNWLISSEGNILQSYEWGEFKARFGWQPIRVVLSDGDRLLAGAQVLVRRTPLGSIAYVPRGPLVDFKQADLVAKMLAALHDIVQHQRVIFLKIEPDWLNSPAIAARLGSYGFRPSIPVQPRSTIIIDLTPDLATLSAHMHIKTRYNIGLAGRKGISVYEGSEADLPLFYRLLEETSRRASFLVHGFSYYQQVWRCLERKGMAQLLLASYQGEVLAGTMIFVIGQHAYYMYSASSGRYRNLKPNELLQWEAIKWAKRAGCTSYDLWGIPDEVGQRAENGEMEDLQEQQSMLLSPLWGVYQFKRGFGGRIVRYSGAYDYVYNPRRYWVWSTALPKLQRMISRLGRHRASQRIQRSGAEE
ncbi:MAG: peptidoglycan bridge formation glycyltransferase FemA/FemB family protein [Chloroflexi bacterium]|nr:peptidoglycan bridge formation glycyltransferase FemA/FemB family protein [Chloroflexota bacterium]MCL5075158.1 peptidoglycan bridge formation glycyltransferase FemA/FemB family protein [Chloroflexota bacterium]